MKTATSTNLRALAKGVVKMIPMMEAMAPLALVQAADEIDRLTEALKGTEDEAFLRRIVDLTWNHVTESTEVPSTKKADEIIALARANLR